MALLTHNFFILGPLRIGRVALAMTRLRFHLRPRRYVSSVGWTAYEFLGIRLYWYKRD